MEISVKIVKDKVRVNYYSSSSVESRFMQFYINLRANKRITEVVFIGNRSFELG